MRDSISLMLFQEEDFSDTIIFAVNLLIIFLGELNQEEGWVVCRVFKKRITTMRKVSEHESPCWYEDQVSFMQDLDSPKPNSQHSNLAYHIPYGCKKELDHHLQYQVPHEHFLQLPLLESPKLMQTAANVNGNPMTAYGLDMNHASTLQQSSSLTQEEHMQQNLQFFGRDQNYEQAVDQVTDWRVLDKFVASQLSQEDSIAANNNVFRGNEQTNNVLVRQLMNKQEMAPENASTSTSSCQIDLWK